MYNHKQESKIGREDANNFEWFNNGPRTREEA